MGQAFDKDGNVLGEADGDTRSEVLQKLEQQFADAARIEIRKRVADLERIGTCGDTPITASDLKAAMESGATDDAVDPHVGDGKE